MGIKLHIVEGLPAAGKSTFAYALERSIKMSRHSVIYHKEETSQPVDLFRQAVLPGTEYKAFAKNIASKNLSKALGENSFLLGSYVVVAYTQLPFDEKERNEMFPFFRSYDIGEGRVSFEKYKSLHLLLWESFAKRACGSNMEHIAEGALLHNQLLDIIGFYHLQESEILMYFKQLSDIMRQLNPHVYYIIPSSLKKSISRALEERGLAEGTWGYGFKKWMELSPYGINNKLNGEQGMLTAYKEILRLSLRILQNINLSYEIIERKL